MIFELTTETYSAPEKLYYETSSSVSLSSAGTNYYYTNSVDAVTYAETRATRQEADPMGTGYKTVETSNYERSEGKTSTYDEYSVESYSTSSQYFHSTTNETLINYERDSNGALTKVIKRSAWTTASGSTTESHGFSEYHEEWSYDEALSDWILVTTYTNWTYSYSTSTSTSSSSETIQEIETTTKTAWVSSSSAYTVGGSTTESSWMTLTHDILTTLTYVVSTYYTTSQGFLRTSYFYATTTVTTHPYNNAVATVFIPSDSAERYFVITRATDTFATFTELSETSELGIWTNGTYVRKLGAEFQALETTTTSNDEIGLKVFTIDGISKTNYLAGTKLETSITGTRALTFTRYSQPAITGVPPDETQSTTQTEFVQKHSSVDSLTTSSMSYTDILWGNKTTYNTGEYHHVITTLTDGDVTTTMPLDRRLVILNQGKLVSRYIPEWTFGTSDETRDPLLSVSYTSYMIRSIAYSTAGGLLQPCGVEKGTTAWETEYHPLGTQSPSWVHLMSPQEAISFKTEQRHRTSAANLPYHDTHLQLALTGDVGATAPLATASVRPGVRVFQPLARQVYGSTTNNKSTFIVGPNGQVNWTKNNGIHGGGYLNEDLSDNQTYLEGRAFWGRLTFHGTEETTVVLAGSLYSFEGSSETSTFFPSQTTLYLSGETTSPATVLGFPGQLPLKPINHGAFVQ